MIKKSGFRKWGNPQNNPMVFTLIHSPSVFSVSSVVNSAGFGLMQNLQGYRRCQLWEECLQRFLQGVSGLWETAGPPP